MENVNPDALAGAIGADDGHSAKQQRPSNSAAGTAAQRKKSALSATLLASAAMPMSADNWRRKQSHSLQGFFDLLLPSGLKLHDCSLHELSGKRWVGLPAKPQITKDNKVLTTPKTGKPAYSCVVEIPDPNRHEAFQAQALAAVDRLLGQGDAP